ncbi:MAG: integrase [Ruminococcaceae bacterium]|nr:integrase [Oscillospiraceae bacterium]
MKKRILTQSHVEAFSNWLDMEEKSAATREKYLRDVRRFLADTGGVPVTKELVADWKNGLIERGYAVRSVNSMLASVNSLLQMLGWGDCRVKSIRLQRQTYCPEERELTKSEYMRLLKAAMGDEQLHLILQTICATGIRVSELRYFTMEALGAGEITVSCKGKTRTIFLPGELRKLLRGYAKRRHIISGAIFRNGKGGALDRSTIWRRMKQLCRRAKVAATKVFPHNLRKLFARTFYAIGKDLAQLADVLGHSSINTTRIYIMSTGVEHRRKIERMGLVVP